MRRRKERICVQGGQRRSTALRECVRVAQREPRKLAEIHRTEDVPQTLNCHGDGPLHHNDAGTVWRVVGHAAIAACPDDYSPRIARASANTRRKHTARRPRAGHRQAPRCTGSGNTGRSDPHSDGSCGRTRARLPADGRLLEHDIERNDYRSIFARGIALNVMFEEAPVRGQAGPEFVRNYHRYADQTFQCYQSQCTWEPVDARRVVFELYASGEYSRMLENPGASNRRDTRLSPHDQPTPHTVPASLRCKGPSPWQLRVCGTSFCPVDFSELSGLALRYADAFAKCGGAALTALYANPFLPPPHVDAAELAELQEQFRRWHAEAASKLRTFVNNTLGAEAVRSKPPWWKLCQWMAYGRSPLNWRPALLWWARTAAAV